MDIQIISIIIIFMLLFILETVDNHNISENFNVPSQECSSCTLKENSVTYPYNNINELGDEKNSLQGKVALTCQNNLMNNISFVSGKETGLTRQCRKLF